MIATNEPSKSDDGLQEFLDLIPEHLRKIFVALWALTDAICDSHLNEEYKMLCRRMAFDLFQTDLPIAKGKLTGWAAGIVSAVGWVNFLHDRSQSPHVTAAQIAEMFDVSQATMAAKSKAIRKALDLRVCDPHWTLPSKLADNPLAWMVQLKDGVVIDIRSAPRELQEEALRLGLIPFIPEGKPPT
jgi:hypothetical protein